MRLICRYLLAVMTVAVLGLFSCKEDVPQLFHLKDGIYFSSSTDSVYYTFAKYPNKTKDTLFIPVAVLGDAASKARIMNVAALDSNDAVLGTDPHFTLQPGYKIDSGQIRGTIAVIVNRTTDLDTAVMKFKLRLLPSSDFAEGITTKMDLKVTLGFLQMPPSWGGFSGSMWAGYSTNFGSWTKTKYKLILDALYDQQSDTTVSEFPYNRFGAPAIYLQYLQQVKNYIRINYPGNYSTPLGIGATLRDPDAGDAVIQVAPANY